METCDNSWSPCLPVAYGMAICNFKVSEFFVGLETPSFEDNANNEDKSQSNSPNSATEPPAIPLNEKKFPKLDQLKLFMVDLMIGDIVQMLEAHASGWTRGYVFIGGQPTLTPILGLFPTTFIQPCILPTFENLYQRLCNFTRHEHYSESELMIRSQEREPNERIAASMSSTLNLEEKRVKPHRDIRFSSQLDIIQFVSHYYGSQAYLTEDNLNSPKPVLPPPLYPCFEKTIGPLGALIDASTAALRDWYSMIYKCLKIQNYVRMHTAKKHFFALLELRKTILLKNEIYTERNHFNGSSPVIDHVLVANFQKSVIKTIEEGNGALNLHHSLLAEDGSIVTNSNHSLLFMKDMYEQMDNRLSLAESNESPNAARRKSINNETEPSAYHVYMDLKSSLPALSSQYYSTEFRFSIFSKRNNSYITDDHVLIVEETFGQDSRSPLEDLRCLFMDFSVEETTHKLFLVCRVVRNGPLKESETHSKIICRRPLAVGFLEINDIFNSRDGSNLLPYQFRLFEHTNDQSFNALLNDLINKSNSCIPLKCEPISLMLRCYTELPTPLGTAITVIEQTNLSEPLNPLVERNSIYLTLESGEFLKTLGKSFEVSLQVRNESHEPLMDAFRQHKGQSSSSEFFFTVFYHTLNPKWNETVRIDLPTPISHESDFSKLYFFFLIRSCSKSAIDKNDRKVAMGFMPFFDVNGAVISSQTTSLTLYKYDKKVETSYTSNHLELPKLLLKDTLNFSISLVSTHHTQSTALVNFLRPEYLLQSSLEDKIIYLTDLKSVQSSELVKFSIPLIYALMRLICEAPLETPPMISSLVFDNILNLLLLVYYDRNPRFNLYRQVIQEHIESNLKLEAAYYNLIQSMQELIQEVRENSKNIESIRKLQFMFKSITHFVRIIVRCGALLKANSSPTENTSKLKSGFTWSSYIETLKSFLDSITSIMTDSLDHLSAIQQLAFVNFSGAFLILKESFEVHELVDRIILFTDASGSQRGSMVQKKLTFISAIVKSDLITGEIEAFFKLSSAVLRWVGDYIGWWDHTSSDTALRAQVYNEC
ncbi:Dedicator of cytokinesis protein 4, partial [Coelomomyces lativittatus]